MQKKFVRIAVALGIFSLCALGGFTRHACAAQPLLAAGGNHSGVTKTDGSLWSWGRNDFGQIGNGGFEDGDMTGPVLSPILIAPQDTWMAIAKGYSHTVAIRTDGTLWAWGRNTSGQLGDGSQTGSLLPKQIGSDNDWALVAAGENHTLAIKSDGTLWAWGDNVFGQLGDGTQQMRLEPKQVGDWNDRWKAVAAGSRFSVALRSDDKLLCWGSNAYGQLGDATTISVAFPQMIVDPDNIGTENPNTWKQITAGFGHVLAIDGNDRLWSWGLNFQDQLGNGSGGADQISTVPVAIGSDSWQQVAAGGFHSAGIQSNGSLWLWGSDSFGQLGDGSPGGQTPVPVQLVLDPASGMSDNDWVSLAAGENHTLALKSNNKFFTWGDNGAGQLGNAGASLQEDTALEIIADVGNVTPPSISIDQFVSPTNQTSQIIGGAVTAVGGAEVATIDVTALHDPANPLDDVVTTISAPFAGDRWLVEVTSLVSGNNAFLITATDDSANQTSITHTIVCDLAPPQVSLAPVVNLTAMPMVQQVAGTFADLLIGRIAVDYAGQTVSAVLDNGTWSIPPIPLAEGVTTLTVHAFDAAGNETVLTPPLAPVLAGVPVTKDRRPSWNWTSGGNGTGAYRHTLDGGTLETTTDTVYVPPFDLAEGEHVLAVQEQDAAGNWSLAGWLTKTIDVTPPAVTFTAPTADEVTKNPQLLFSLSESGTATVYADGAATLWQSGSTMTFGADGRHDIMVVTTDTLGNTTGNPSPYVLSFFIDTTPPGITAPSDMFNNNADGSVSLSGWIGEADAVVTVATDTAASDGTASIISDGFEGTWVYPVTGLTEGVNNVTVTACDALNNCTSLGFKVVYDVTKPLNPNVSGETPTRDTTPTWSWTSGGGGNGTYSYALDGGPAREDATTSFTPETALAEGSHTLAVRERDDAENWSPAASFSILVDVTPPGKPTISTDKELTNMLRPTWSWSSGGGGNGTYTYVLDKGTPDEKTATNYAATNYTPATDLGEGLHTLTVQEQDDAGNLSAEASLTIVIDLTPPLAPGLNGSELTRIPRPTWTWTSGGGGNGTYSYVLDAGRPGEKTATNYAATSYTPDADLGEGPHTFTVREQDDAGNLSSPASFTTAIDLTVPPPPIVTSDAVTRNLRPSWRWQSGGGSGHYRYKFANSPDWVETGATSFTPEIDLTEAEYRLNVQEEYEAGIWSADGWSVTVIDLTPPNKPQVTGSNVTNEPRPTWSWTSGGNGGAGIYRYILDGVQQGEGSVTTFTATTDLGEGTPHTLEVQERDAVDNWSQAASFTTVIDLTVPPAPTVTSEAVTNNRRPTWTWTSNGGTGNFRYAFDGAPEIETTATSFIPTEDLAEGPHTLKVWEKDDADNWSADGWFKTDVDLTPPQVTIAPVVDLSAMVQHIGGTFFDPHIGRIDVDYAGQTVTAVLADNGTWNIPARSLTDLAITVTVHAYDTAGHETILTPPGAPLVTGSAVTNDQRSGWEWVTGGNGTGTYRYMLDGGAVVPTTATSYIPSVDLSEDEHTLAVQEQDAAGNWSLAGWMTTTVDTTPPVATFTSPAAGAITNNLQLLFTLSESGTATVYADGVETSWQSGSTMTFDDGQHEIMVVTTDQLGNTTGYPSPYVLSFKVDTTAPGFEIPLNRLTNAADKSMFLSAWLEEDAASVTVTTDTAASDGAASIASDGQGGWTWSYTITGLVEGINTVTVTACDVLNNCATASFQVVYDVTPPLRPIVTGSSSTTDTTPTWTWISGGGGNGTYRYALDKGTFSAETTVTSFTATSALSLTDHILEVQEKDDAGNWSAPGTFTITVTTEVPNPPQVSGPAITREKKPTWTWTSGGGGNGTYSLELDAVAVGETTATSYTASMELPDDNHTLVVKEKNDTGLWSAESSWTILVDTRPPAAPQVTAPAITNNPIPTWSWTSGGNGGDGTFRYVFDGAAPVLTTATSFVPSAALSEGPHTLKVQERDAARNWSLAATKRITVDLTSPVVTITSPSTGQKIAEPVLDFSVSEAAATIVSIDGAATSFEDGSTLTLAPGLHRLQVTATDAAGNVGVSAEVAFIVVDLGFDIDPPISPTNRTAQRLQGPVDAGIAIAAEVQAGSVACEVTSGRWTCDVADMALGNNAIILKSIDLQSGDELGTKTVNIFVASALRGEATVSDGTAAVTLPLTQPYDTPVIILGPLSRNDVEPVAARVAGVMADTFTIHLDNWIGTTPHGEETISWLALEPGRYLMDDGAIWEIGTFQVSEAGSFVFQSFDAAFPDVPQVFLTVQTRAEADPIVARLSAVSAAGFEAALFEGEGRHDGHGPETVGYLAIYRPQGPGTADFANGSWPYLVQNVGVSSTPRQLFANYLMLEEETTGDAETDHGTEQTSVLATGAYFFGQVESFAEADPVTLRRQQPAGGSDLDWGEMNVSPGNWITVPLSGSIADPVLVVKSLSAQDSGYIEIQNVTASAFEMRYTNWNGSNVPVHFFYLAAPRGRSTFAGLPVEAGRLSCDALLSASAPVNFAAVFTGSNPAVFAGLQAPGTDGPLQVRVSDLTPAGFSLNLRGALGQGAGTGCGGGTVGWIAVGQGVGVVEDVTKHYVMAFHATASDAGNALSFYRPFSELIKSTIQGNFTTIYPGVEYSYGRVVFDRYYTSPNPVLIGDISSAFDVDPAELYLDVASLTAKRVILRIREQEDAPHVVPEDISMLLIE